MPSRMWAVNQPRELMGYQFCSRPGVWSPAERNHPGLLTELNPLSRGSGGQGGEVDFLQDRVERLGAMPEFVGGVGAEPADVSAQVG